jgi:hypothetical protein
MIFVILSEEFGQFSRATDSTRNSLSWESIGSKATEARPSTQNHRVLIWRRLAVHRIGFPAVGTPATGPLDAGSRGQGRLCRPSRPFMTPPPRLLRPLLGPRKDPCTSFSSASPDTASACSSRCSATAPSSRRSDLGSLPLRRQDSARGGNMTCRFMLRVDRMRPTVNPARFCRHPVQQGCWKGPIARPEPYALSAQLPPSANVPLVGRYRRSPRSFSMCRVESSVVSTATTTTSAASVMAVESIPATRRFWRRELSSPTRTTASAACTVTRTLSAHSA